MRFYLTVNRSSYRHGKSRRRHWRILIAVAAATVVERCVGKLCLRSIVTRLDRLARSTRDLLNIMASIDAMSARFKSLGDIWADTATPHGRLMTIVLDGLAEFERELIRAGTGEGRARSKARGVKLGRKPKFTAHQRGEALRRKATGEESLVDIGRSYNVSAATISRPQA